MAKINNNYSNGGIPPISGALAVNGGVFGISGAGGSFGSSNWSTNSTSLSGSIGPSWVIPSDLELQQSILKNLEEKGLPFTIGDDDGSLRHETENCLIEFLMTHYKEEFTEFMKKKVVKTKLKEE